MSVVASPCPSPCFASSETSDAPGGWAPARAEVPKQVQIQHTQSEAEGTRPGLPSRAGCGLRPLRARSATRAPRLLVLTLLTTGSARHRNGAAQQRAWLHRQDGRQAATHVARAVLHAAPVLQPAAQRPQRPPHLHWCGTAKRPASPNAGSGRGRTHDPKRACSVQRAGAQKQRLDTCCMTLGTRLLHRCNAEVRRRARRKRDREAPRGWRPTAARSAPGPRRHRRQPAPAPAAPRGPAGTGTCDCQA